MTTNGQIFVPELVEAFNEFNQFSNLKILSRIQKKWRNNKRILEMMLQSNTDKHARITFSTDRFHAPISENIRELYAKSARGLEITNYTVRDEDIKKIGLSTFGKELENGKLLYTEEDVRLRTIFQMLYITAKGDIIFGGDGSYEYIDAHVLGKLNESSIFDLTEIHGEDVFKRNLAKK